MTDKEIYISSARKTLLEHRIPFYLGMSALVIVFVSSAILFEYLIQNGNETNVAILFAKNISYAVASAIFLTLIIDGFILRRNMTFQKAYIGEVFEEKLEGSGIQIHGINHVHDGMPHRILKGHIETADEIVFLQTFVADLVQLESTLRKFFSRGGTARVLLLNPDSPLVDIRSSEITNISPQAFRLSILQNIGMFFDLGADKVEIRLHNTIPSVSIYGDQDRLFVGNYLQRHHAVQGPILEVTEGFYKNKLFEHFEHIWADRPTFAKKEFETLRDTHDPQVDQ